MTQRKAKTFLFAFSIEMATTSEEVAAVTIRTGTALHDLHASNKHSLNVFITREREL